MDTPFIDVHTHKEERPGVVSIRNIFPGDFNPDNFRGTETFSVGLHPWHIGNRDWNDEELIKILDRAALYPGMLAVGEAGLDKTINVDLELQKHFFVLQLKLSERFQRPLIIHCVRAYQEILGLRKELDAMQPWIFHGFTGSPQLARQCINSGCYLSFGAALMKSSQRAMASLKSLGSGDFFLETDSGDYSVEEIYCKAEIILNTSEEELKFDVFNSFNKAFKYFDR